MYRATSVDDYIKRVGACHDELIRLRDALRSIPLVE